MMNKNKNVENERIQVELSLDQAKAAVIGLDVYSRLCIGQIDTVEHLVRDGTIPKKSDTSERQIADIDTCDEVRDLVDVVKTRLGYPISGSMGIGNPHVHITGRRAYELRAVLAKVIADHRHKPGTFRGVDHDGLRVRYTQDAPPVANLFDRSKSRTDTVERAFQIADQSMLELLQSHALPATVDHYTLVNASGQEVESLAEADPAIQEAVEWLVTRGMAEVIEGADGDSVMLLADAATCG